MEKSFAFIGCSSSSRDFWEEQMFCIIDTKTRNDLEWPKMTYSDLKWYKMI